LHAADSEAWKQKDSRIRQLQGNRTEQRATRKQSEDKQCSIQRKSGSQQKHLTITKTGKREAKRDQRDKQRNAEQESQQPYLKSISDQQTLAPWQTRQEKTKKQQNKTSKAKRQMQPLKSK
jgi:phosphate starvation-inducible protein PhoH